MNALTETVALKGASLRDWWWSCDDDDGWQQQQQGGKYIHPLAGVVAVTREQQLYTKSAVPCVRRGGKGEGFSPIPPNESWRVPDAASRGEGCLPRTGIGDVRATPVAQSVKKVGAFSGGLRKRKR